MGKIYARVFQACFKVGMAVLPWRIPETLEGPDCIKKLPARIKKDGFHKVLVVTDAVLMKLGALNGLFAAMDEAGIAYTIYDKAEPNPTDIHVNNGVDLYKASGCECMIAFGGGSPMDCAKAACARVVRPNKTIPQMRGQLKVMHKLPPFFAVPTTAGTGSETTLAAVVSNTKTHEKYAINDPCLRPKFAVLDPELTVGLPPHITSTTGMDALTHAVEAYIGKSNTKSTRDYAEKAVAIIFANLETAYKDGKNINARGQMLLGSFYGGMAFTRAYVGYVHAVAHNLGGMYGIPHGLANAVILPVMLEEYGSAIYPQLSKLANFAGIEGTSDDDKAKKFIAEVYAMNERMNIPKGFTQIKEEDIPTIVSRALKEANPLYPVPVIFDEDRMTQIVKKLMITE